MRAQPTLNRALALGRRCEIARAHEQRVRSVVVIDRASPVICRREAFGRKIRLRATYDEVVVARFILAFEPPSDGGEGVGRGAREKSAAPAVLNRRMGVGGRCCSFKRGSNVFS